MWLSRRNRSLLLCFASASIASAAPTFNQNIAPILYRHCVSCHHAGEVAPFPLVTYADAKRRAGLLAAVTRQRSMPPWQPEHGYATFAGERRLSTAEIAQFQTWSATGALEGNSGPAPPVPQFAREAGWTLGKPDAIVTMGQPFTVPGDQADVYQCFVIPLREHQDRYVRAFEFRPSNRRVVHHALFFTRRRAADLGSYPCFGTPGFLPTSSLGGWSPGNGPVRMPEGAAARLPADSDLVMQIHFHATGKPETEQSELGLYFTSLPPSRKVMDVGLTSRRIDIPAGDSDYLVTDHFTLPIDVQAIGIIPHAHYVCKQIRGWALLPGGRKQWLLSIRDWNFDWQEQYRYAVPIRLPADTRIEVEFHYDNSTANVRNPNSPPKRVTWGAATTDEMAGFHLQVIPDRMADLPELGRALWGKVMRDVGGGFYRRAP